MGYYTRYSLEVQAKTTKEEDLEITNFLSQRIMGESARIGEHWEDYLEEEMKWYDYKKDMLDLSTKFPDITFKLKGEGEESGDIWEMYFLNGKSQYCPGKIIFDEFDESKLV